MSETIRDFLSSYRVMLQEIDELEQRLASLREELTSVSSPVCSAVPRSSSRQDLADRIACLCELEQSYRKALLKARVRCAKIEHWILSLSSPRQKQILRARYLEGLSWEEVRGRFILSESMTYALHKRALSELDLRYGSSVKKNDAD